MSNTKKQVEENLRVKKKDFKKKATVTKQKKMKRSK